RRLYRLSASPEHGLANCLGAARPDGRGRGRQSRSESRSRLSVASSRRGWPVAGGTFHRHRIPTRVLFTLSRLREVLPAVGAGTISQPQAGQHDPRAGRNVVMLVVVAGLTSEARLAKRAGQRTIIGGGDAI